MKDKMKYLLIILVAGGLGYYAISSGLINLPSLPSLPSLPFSEPTIKVQARDADGNVVATFSVASRRMPTYSVVEGKPSVEVLDFALTAKNNGKLPVTVIKAPTGNSPSVFDSILSDVITSRVLQAGETAVYSTQKPCVNDIDCGIGRKCISSICGVTSSQFEAGVQPTVFSVNFQGDFDCPTNNPAPCQGSSGPVSPGQHGIIYASASKPLNIYSGTVQDASLTADLQAGFGASNCLATGTTCSLDSSCCSAVCQSNTQETSTGIPCTSYGGSKSCNADGIETYVYIASFTCPLTATRCEIYQSGTSSSDSTVCNSPSSPQLVQTCSPGVLCKYTPSPSGTKCYRSYNIVSSITKSCA